MTFGIMLGLAAVFATGTWAIGWWTVPLLAFAAAALVPRRAASPLVSTGAGALAWAAILIIHAVSGASILFWAGRLGGVMQLPAWAFIAATLVLPAVMAGTAAVLGGAVVRR